jgi:hypothetical protein
MDEVRRVGRLAFSVRRSLFGVRERRVLYAKLSSTLSVSSRFRFIE